MKEPFEFNLNHNVEVLLTERGKEILVEYDKRKRAEYTGSGRYPFLTYEDLEDGYVALQGHMLMTIFGPVKEPNIMNMTVRIPHHVYHNYGE